MAAIDMLVLFYALPMLLIAGALYDVATMTLPNWLTGLIVALFPVAALAAGMPMGQAAAHLGAAAVLLAVGMALFATGKVGAGDGKLMAAIGLWVGFGQMLPFLMFTAIFGGVFALALIAFRRLPLPMALASRPWLLRLHGHDEGIPYGVALAGAALAVLPQTDLARLAL